jgi:sugar/nucleoside kinase (ribokinase family)
VTPDILVLGQITVDDTVPATPGPWYRRLGGNALYAAAGARLWCDPARVGVVARISTGFPFNVQHVLEEAGLTSKGLVSVNVEPLIEWIVYEEDGNRQSLPRNPALRDPSVSSEELFQRYLAHLESLSASVDNIPTHWLPAKAVHLAPQVLSRHKQSCRALAAKVDFLSVDPSPHYSRGSSAEQLVEMLAGTTAFLPSQAEVQHLAEVYPDWFIAAAALRNSGFQEVVVKRGAAGAILCTQPLEAAITLPVATALVEDPTGAGDAFSGAYAASRALGHSPQAAAARATIAASMVIECAGTEQALALKPQNAEARLSKYLSSFS